MSAARKEDNVGIFGSQNKSTSRINDVQVNESSQGRPVTVVMGQAKVNQTILWTNGLVSWKDDQGGKGGGKGSSQYLYASDVIAGLCNGPVTSIGDVWDGQSWLSSQWGNGTFTVSTNGVYSPASAATLIANNGVAFATTFSATYNDYGAPAATILSGTDYAPLVQVPYGTTLTTGHYSVNPTSIGTFVLTAAANASGGNTVYTGTITGGTSPYTSGASNAYIGFMFVVNTFTNAANNGTFLCIASTATTITLVNALGVAETHAATAAETGNSYHFYSGDAGKTAVVSYQYTVQDMVQQEVALIPSSGHVTIGGTFNPTYNMGVWYYNSNGSSGPTTLVKMTPVSGTPTAAGQYHFSTPGIGSTGGGTYTFYVGAGGDLNQEVLMQWQYQNNSVAPGNAGNLLKFQMFGGGLGQAVWPFILTGGKVQIGNQDGGQSPSEPAFPDQALGYSNTAYLGYGPMALGSSGAPANVTVEVLTPHSYGGYYSTGANAGQPIVDCNPVTNVFQVLTNAVWGLGNSVVPFPTSVIDNGTSGTWGGPAGTPGARQSGSTAWNWFASNSFFISPVMDTQETAASHIGKWLEAGMCAAFMSEGLLKLVPYGTQSAAGNGCTWVAPSSVVVALDDTCFIEKEGEEPVKIQRSAWQDASNQTQINWNNRAFQYSPELTQESDQGAINRFGLRLEDPQSFSFITTLSAATFAGTMRVKRLTNVRNTYTFTLPFTYSYLEPMDLVSITTSSVWAAGLNNINLGVVALPVRITKIVDDVVSGIAVTCEDSLFAAGLPTIYNKGISAGAAIANLYLPPGNTEVVMFEATARMTAQQGNQIWMGAIGQSQNWGSCNIWVSQDGTKYQQVGTITTPARIGALDSTFASGSDPDTVNSLVVDLAQNCGALEAGSTSDADSGNTLCFVDGEVIAYSACTVTGQNQYTMNGYTRRAQMGTTVASHAGGSLFMRLDSAVYKYTYDPTLAGTTLYFKFQSVNNFNNCPQDLSTLTPVPFTVPGNNPGTIDVSSGLVLTTSGSIVGNGPLAWTPVATTTDSTINYSSAPYSYSGSVVAPTGVNANYWYARWTGYLIPAVTGEYTIGLNSDDGSTLYIGGTNVGINELGISRASTANLTYSTGSSATVLLTKGVYYPVVVEWKNGASGYALQLMWTTPTFYGSGGVTQLIPSANLSTSSTSITGNLSGSWWNGTTGLYYPSGTGLVDPANTTLYGPPTSGGGINVANTIAVVTGTQTSPQISPNSQVGPGWIVGQAYSAAGIVDIFLAAGGGASPVGYTVRCDFRSGFAPCIFLTNVNLNTSFGTQIATGTNNAAAITGWVNFAIYTGAAGYIGLWINGNLACQVTDTTYLVGNSGRQIWYFYEVSSTAKIAPAPNASGAGSSGLTKQGSIANAAQNSTFSYTSTTTSITWTWTAFSIYCPDGSTISIPASTSGTQLVTTGLSASSTYYFSFYVTLATKAVSDISGTAALTQQQVVQTVNGDGNTPIVLNITASTPASGSGGGSGTGGGKSCFSPNTKVKTQRGDVAVSALITGVDKVLTARGSWKTIEFVTCLDHNGPMLDMGDEELSTLSHLTLDKQDWVTMQTLNRFPTVQYDGTIHNIHVETELDDDGTEPNTEHSYTLSNGLTVHNVLT
jgi:Putative phage tail protein/PA14 domain